MTVADLAVRIAYTETDDPETLYAIPFQYLGTDQVQVTRTIDGEAIVLTGGYSVTGDGRASPPTGKVQIAEPVADAELAIARVTARVQPTEYTDRADFPSDLHQDSADRTVMIVQEQDGEIARSFRVPAGEEAAALPAATERAGKVLAFDVDGAPTPLELTGEGDSVSLLASLALSTGAALVGWVQTIAAGAFGVVRSVRDKLRDHLDLRDFAGADPTGLTDSTAALQRATAEMIASGRPLRISRGTWLFSGSALSTASAAALTDNVHIYGDGQGGTRIVNHCVAGTSLFNIGNTRFATIRDLTITGNALTGASGNGHAIDLTNPGTIGSTAFYPSFTRLERMQVRDHCGDAVAYGGGTMPACGIYDAGSLGLKVDHVYLGHNQFGCYDLRSAQPTYDTCTWDSNLIAGLVNDQCENLRNVRPDMVGDHGIGATLAVTGAAGKLRVGANGVQTAGGALVKAGAVTDYFGFASEYVGGKYKNHLYAGLSIYSPHQPLVLGAYIRQEVDGTCGVFSAYGARTQSCTFALANAVSGTISNRYGLWTQAQGGFADVGTHRGNRFLNGGGGASYAYGTAVFIDGSQAGGGAQAGEVSGCSLGDGAGAGSASTWTAFIRVTNVAGGLALRDNHANVAPNITVTTVYDFTGVTTSNEGLLDDNNSYLVQGGTVGTGKVSPTDYTGLQRSGKYNVKGLTVAGVQVVGARSTGWTAMTGSGSTAALAAAAAGTASGTYQQSELQAALDRIAALEARLKSCDDALFAHGLIGA